VASVEDLRMPAKATEKLLSDFVRVISKGDKEGELVDEVDGNVFDTSGN
jgi:hypothetical protein